MKTSRQPLVLLLTLGVLGAGLAEAGTVCTKPDDYRCRWRKVLYAKNVPQLLQARSRQCINGGRNWQVGSVKVVNPTPYLIAFQWQDEELFITKKGRKRWKRVGNSNVHVIHPGATTCFRGTNKKYEGRKLRYKLIKVEIRK